MGRVDHPPLPDQRLKQAGPVTGTNPLA
jgi:hypothetical protein